MPSIFDGPFLEPGHMETPVGPLFPELYDVSDGEKGDESATASIGAKVRCPIFQTTNHLFLFAELVI